MKRRILVKPHTWTSRSHPCGFMCIVPHVEEIPNESETREKAKNHVKFTPTIFKVLPKTFKTFTIITKPSKCLAKGKENKQTNKQKTGQQKQKTRLGDKKEKGHNSTFWACPTCKQCFRQVWFFLYGPWLENESTSPKRWVGCRYHWLLHCDKYMYMFFFRSTATLQQEITADQCDVSGTFRAIH